MIKYKYGWKQQPFDPRDRFHFAREDRHLAPYFDNSPNMGRQLDQGAEGPCGPNTAAEMIEFDQIVQNLLVAGASRLFVYWYTRYLMGTVMQDSGVDNRTMLKALANYGFPAEALWPYDDSTASMVKQPTPAVATAAKLNCITDYAAVVQSLTQMKGVLAGGKPFMFGFSVYSQMESAQAAANGILSDPKGTSVGGHDVTFVGYSDVARPGVLPGNTWPAGYFKFRNHWMNDATTPWGDGGYGYISYAYATNKNYASDFWVINTIPGSAPLPPSPPPPPPPPPGPVVVVPKKLVLLGDLDKEIARYSLS